MKQEDTFARTRLAKPALTTRTHRQDTSATVVVSGPIESRTAGDLTEALIHPVREGCNHLIVDLSDAHRVTRAGVMGLTVAAKLLQVRGGSMQIRVADTCIEADLRHHMPVHLLLLEWAGPGSAPHAGLPPMATSLAEALTMPSPSVEGRSAANPRRVPITPPRHRRGCHGG